MAPSPPVKLILRLGKRVFTLPPNTEQVARNYIAGVYRQGYIVIDTPSGYEALPASRLKFEVVYL